jgi:hypothetical protein
MDHAAWQPDWSDDEMEKGSPSKGTATFEVDLAQGFTFDEPSSVSMVGEPTISWILGPDGRLMPDPNHVSNAVSSRHADHPLPAPARVKTRRPEIPGYEPASSG